MCVLYFYADYSADSTAVIMVTTKEILLIDEGIIIANETLPSTVQVPELSALTHTATMAEINRIAYFGGLNGITYKINVHESEDKVSMSISNVTLDIPCIAESFTYHTNTGTSGSCYWNDTNSLYVISIDSPSERQPFRFTDQGYTSMIVPVDDTFYYAHNNHLIKANLNIGHLTVATLTNCEYPFLVANPYHYIVIQCLRFTSKVYVPEEWNGAFGFREGGWKDSNETLYPCYGSGSSPLVYSVDGKLLTFYDIRNNFRQSVTHKGNPVIDTLTCILNDNQLILIYAERSCDCWMQHVFNEDYNYTASYPVPGANGILPAYMLGNSAITQKVLVFQYHGSVKYVMIPSTQQVLVDISANITYTDITSNVVFYFSLIPLHGNGDAVKEEGGSSKLSKHWGLFLGGAIFVAIVLVVMAPFVSAAAYKLHRKWGRR